LNFKFFCQNHNYIVLKWEKVGSNLTSNLARRNLAFLILPKKKITIKGYFSKAHTTLNNTPPSQNNSSDIYTQTGFKN
jgi:hypothetical protein